MGRKAREMSEYEDRARQIAQDLGLTVSAVFADDKCPRWCDGKHIHGDRYRITITRAHWLDAPLNKYARHEPDHITFDFWNSHADKQEGKVPDYYNVLSAVSSDMSAPTDPDEVAAEFGEMKPSQAIAVASFAKRLQAFFSEAEREALERVDA